MAVSFVKFQPFSAAKHNKVHNLSADVLTLALCNQSNPPVATNGQLSELVQISYTNLSSRVLTGVTSAQIAGTYRLACDDLTLTALTGTVAAFQYIVLYNDTATNDELIGYYNPGGQLTLNIGDSLVLDFDQVSGILSDT